MDNPILSRLSLIKSKWVFVLFWLLTCLVYIFTRKAGWVIDGAGFLYNMKHENFLDFINTKNSADQGFYQLYALHYYIFYKLWGMNEWLWALSYITLQAFNATLFFILFRNILSDTIIKNATLVALSAAAIFTISPYISEVLVWKACFHYLMAFCFILSIMLLVQKYQHNQSSKYIWGSVLIFILAAFTNAIFYLVPFFVFTLAMYYRLALGYNKMVFRKTLLYFFLPQLLMLGIYFAGLYLTFHVIRPHKTEFSEPLLVYLSKPLKYLYHIIFLGRYFSMQTKKSVYAVCESLPAIIAFYGLLTGYFVYCLARIKKLGNSAKAVFLVISLVMLTLFFLLPLSFPDPALLVFYDRYTYFTDGFVYLLLALLTRWLIRNKYVIIGLFCAYVDVNVFFTVKVNTYWIDSEVINNKLLHNFPNDENKTVLLLNIPENMNGAPMIGAQPEGMFKAMREIYTDTILKNNVYDVASYNMMADYNGAHIKVMNDSEMKVILNHTGTWWWYEGHGARSYETPDYKVSMQDTGNMYILKLKHPVDQYLLLYNVGDQWKKVDMHAINVQQD